MKTDSILRQYPILWLIIAIVFGGLVFLLAPILTPFLLAFIVAYLGEPIVRLLEKWKAPRWLAILVGYLLLLCVSGVLILMVLPLAQEQLQRAIEQAPVYKATILGYLQPVLDIWRSYSGTVKSSLTEQSGSNTAGSVASLAKDAVPRAGDIIGNTVGVVTRSGLAIATTLMNLFLVPVLAFYFLRDWNKLGDHSLQLVPKRYRKKTASIAQEVDEVLHSFLMGQLLVMMSLAFMYSTGLWLIGLEFGLLIGAIAGLLSVVPFLGTIIGLVLATIAMLVQTGQWQELWLVVLVFGVGQFIEGNILTPKLVGDKIDLHPVVVIFVVLAGGQLFGFTGVLLALPTAAVGWVIIKRTVGELPAEHATKSE